MKELTVEARPESIPRIIEFVDGELDGLGCPVKTKTQIDIAIDDDPRACYFKQVLYGKYMRMALILKLLKEAGTL